MSHPIPGLPEHERAMQEARVLYDQLNCPLFVLPGNHDVGDKPNAWTPAPAVTMDAQYVFEEFWGPSFQSFDFENCHFVLINSSVLNSGLERENIQRKWLQASLEACKQSGKRILIFTHYPLYLYKTTESEHYDNIGEPARSWLLSLLREYAVEAVFASHVHNFFYNRYSEVDTYALPSLAFTRPEYSALFDIAPAPEYGRDDNEKLGFFLVSVNDVGHDIKFVRSAATPQHVSTTVTKQRASFGITLRQSWAAPIELPHDNLDEFSRKRVRNDHPLLALWELGIWQLRLPLTDLAEASTRERMQALRSRGHSFIVFSVGMPGIRERDLVIEHNELIEMWEVVAPANKMAETLWLMGEVRQSAPLQIALSRLEGTADQPRNGAFEFSHFPVHGFRLQQRYSVLAGLREFDAMDFLDSLVFRLDESREPWAGIQAAAEFATESALTIVLLMALPRATEGRVFDDDAYISEFVAQTYVAALGEEHLHVILDTFVDHDRGYYPRHGLLDRRYNPRPAFHVLRRLNEFFARGSTSFMEDKPVC